MEQADIFRIDLMLWIRILVLLRCNLGFFTFTEPFWKAPLVMICIKNFIIFIIIIIIIVIIIIIIIIMRGCV